MKYRKRPVIVEAIQFNDQSSINRMCNVWQKEFMNVADFDVDEEKENFFIETLEDVFVVSLNDYVIKGVKGEFYPCKPDIFEMTYEKVEEKT